MVRQTGVDTPALPPDRPAPRAARYHRTGDPWPLYASLEPATVWAEWNAATRGAVDPAGVRRRLWRIDVAGLPVIDLRRPSVRAELDVELADLTATRAGAQALASRALAVGAEGMVVPSAAHDGHWNLVVLPSGFGKLRVAGSSTTRPKPPA